MRLRSLISAVLFGVGTAQASTIQLGLSDLFNGLSPAVNATPWARATFTDTTTPGLVQLTMESINLWTGPGTPEFISDWWFNVALDPWVDLTAKFVSSTGPVKDDITVTIGPNCCKADGDGAFDIRFAFPTSNAPGVPRFVDNTTVVFTLQGSGLTADAFRALSAPQGGAAGGLPTLAHVQSIGGDSGKGGYITSASGFTSVAEPTMSMLVGASLLAFGALVRRRGWNH